MASTEGVTTFQKSDNLFDRLPNELLFSIGHGLSCK
jgi:hypothetical protein